MNRRIIVAAVAGILSIVATPLYAGPTETFAKFAEGSKKTVDHTAWDRLLETYVMPGDDGLNRVNYKQFKKAGHEELKGYVKTLESIQPATSWRPGEIEVVE